MFELIFMITCSLCRVELVVQFPARGRTQVLLCLFPGILWLLHFLYSVGPHPVSILHIHTFVVSRAFMVGAASEAGDADSSRALGLTSGLKGSVNVHRGALFLVPQWQCISSFVFYIYEYDQSRQWIGQYTICFPCKSLFSPIRVSRRENRSRHGSLEKTCIPTTRSLLRFTSQKNSDTRNRHRVLNARDIHHTTDIGNRFTGLTLLFPAADL